MKHYCLSLLLLITNLCFGQSQRIAHWYFGAGAGIDFTTGAASADINGKMASTEGSSTMSDLSGNLLFYSNGEKVWNSAHAVMPNGSNLKGDQSSTQSSLIVPLPGSDHLYYLFTAVGSSAIPSGMYYNIVDMDLNGGLGDVTKTKNSQLFATSTEQLAGTQHCNGVDFWIVGRQSIEGVLKFYAWQLTKNGLSAPVISTFDAPNHTYNTVGTMTFSQDGKLMALTTFEMDTYLFDFDTKTGALSVKAILGRKGGEEVYSNAISPDNSKLYTTSVANSGYNYLTQFDLSAADVTASRINIDSVDFRHGSPNSFGYIAQIRLASDQQIYVSRWNQDHPFQVDPDYYYSLDSIDVIHKPNLSGLACQPQRNYLYLQSKPTMLGLPNFISNYTSPAPTSGCPIDPSLIDFAVSGECKTPNLRFTYTGPSNITSVEWTFGDPASGINNTSVQMTPAHVYPQPDAYLVNLTVYYNGGADAITVSKTVKVGAFIPVDLGNDTTLCEKDSLVLQAPTTGASIKWQDNSGAPTFIVHDTGTYYVTVTQYGCSFSDSIAIKYIRFPEFTLGPDRPLCGDEKIILAPTIKDTGTLQYAWQDGSEEKTFLAVTPGQYILGLTNTCGTTKDTILVKEGLCTLQVPSAFTPNQDGKNDLFRAHGDHISQFNMSIYNRYGQKIFESADINKGWDGYFHGHRQPPGVYVWTVKYTDVQVKNRVVTGSLTLID